MSVTEYSQLNLGLDNVEDTVVDQLGQAENAINSALANSTNDGDLSTGEALELQYELAKWSLLYEAASNIGKKIDDAISSAVSNLR